MSGNFVDMMWEVSCDWSAGA